MTHAQTIENWIDMVNQKVFNERATVLSGTYVAGTGPGMTIEYVQNAARDGYDRVTYMGETTWLMRVGNEPITDWSMSGSGVVTFKCEIAKSSSNGKSPGTFGGRTVNVTFRLSSWRAREISLRGTLFSPTGTNSVNNTYRRK